MALCSRGEVFQLLPAWPRDRAGNHWILDFPHSIGNWKEHCFMDGRYVQDWSEDDIRGISPEGEDRATDYMFANGWPIFSRSFGEAFDKRFPGQIQFLPFAYGPPSGQFEKRTHSIGQVLHLIYAIDRKNALVDNDDWAAVEKGNGQVRYPVVLIRDIVLKHPVFRTKFAPVQVYVHADVRQFIEENHFTGFRFDDHNPILTTQADLDRAEEISECVNAEIEAIYAALTSQSVEDAKVKKWYKRKTRFIEKHLGVEADVVTRAIIPFSMGGGLDLYFYPQEQGVAVVTKDLSQAPNRGPLNSVFNCYEIAIYLPMSFTPSDIYNEKSRFGAAMAIVNAALEHLGRLSVNSELNPGDTIEFPNDLDFIGGKCFVLDQLTSASKSEGFGLIVAIEIDRRELVYCKYHSSKEFLQRFKQMGFFPYSNLERQLILD